MKEWFTLPNRRICIFGSGYRGSRCKKILEYRFYLKIHCFIDNDNQKYGQKLDGLMIVSPQELIKIKEPVICFIATQARFQKKIKSQLKKMGITRIIKYNYPSDLWLLKEFLPYRESSNNLSKKFIKESLNSKSAKLIAIYLPQFHTIPENDKWWGKGFTEWTNVKSIINKPQIQSQAIPGELGYYNLADVSVMQKQAELAKKYGIHAFCFYHYYLGNGKRLLEKPLENYLKSNIDFPFCLCWANHDWGRYWGADPEANKEILIKQTYEDHRKHFEVFLKFFKDKRYIKINGKPLFVVWQADIIPNVSQVAKLWKKCALDAGFPGLYLLKWDWVSGGMNRVPEKIGFDASMGFLPSWDLHKFSEMIDKFFEEHIVFDYNEYNRFMAKRKTNYKRFPGVFTRWDNTARYKEHSTLILNSTPEKYRQWLSYSIEQAQQFKEEERFVFINAWNEWGEGAVLEPDTLSGRAYLEATLQALHPKIRKLDLEMLKLLGLI